MVFISNTKFFTSIHEAIIDLYFYSKQKNCSLKAHMNNEKIFLYYVQVITLEVELIETQKRFGLPVRLPYDATTVKIVTPQLLRRQLPPPSSDNSHLSDTETSDISSPDEEDKTATVERKLPLPIPVKEELDIAVPAHCLLDNSAGKSKAELASRGGLANRQLPKRASGLSNSSSVSN